MTEDEAIRKVIDCQQGEAKRSYCGFITIVINIIIIVLLLVLFGRVDVFILVFVLCADFDEFARRLRITEFFHDYTSDNQSDPFHPRSLWTPPTDRDDALNTYLNTVKHDLFTTKPRRIRDNLPKAQRRMAQLTVASSKAQHYLNSPCTTPKRPPSTSKFSVDFKNFFQGSEN